MRLKKSLLLALVSLLLAFFIQGCRKDAKEPAVAGAFYPADEKTLRETVNGFIAVVPSRDDISGRLVALISPHAGYQFSGQVAAFSYSHLKGRNIDTVILIGPSHHVGFNGASVYVKGSMKTPLGNIRIDEKTAKSLIDEKADVSFYPGAFEKEHSIEVQLPFLQQALKDFRIVPIVIGTLTGKSFHSLAEKLSAILRKNDRAIIVASTDLSHYHDYDTAVKMDRKIIDAVERMSVEDAERYLMTGEAEMCGGYPVILAMSIARMLGANSGVLYKYANSGDVTGEKSNVVGYAAIGLYQSALSKEEKDFLLSLAKNTITDYVTYGRIPEIDVKDPRLASNVATFVTIKTNGQLRGCIGNIEPVMPLYMSVIRNAVAASSKDPRFPPMNKEELKNMEVEISILSPLEPLADVKNIEIGRHGLFLVKGQNSGLLLPQVATELGWDMDAFLENLSIKAGLPKDAWKGASLYTFTAEIIK